MIYLLLPLLIEKNYLYEVKLCCKPRETSTSVNLLHSYEKISQCLPTGFTLIFHNSLGIAKLLNLFLKLYAFEDKDLKNEVNSLNFEFSLLKGKIKIFTSFQNFFFRYKFLRICQHTLIMSVSN